MEAPLNSRRENFLIRELSTEIVIGTYQHNNDTYHVMREPFLMSGDMTLDFARLNIYDMTGENLGLFFGRWKEEAGVTEFIVEKSRSFADSYHNPKYRSLLKALVKYLVDTGVVWKSDLLQNLSGEDEIDSWEENAQRNATHMYNSLHEDSQDPKSDFTCEIEDNRYVLRKK